MYTNSKSQLAMTNDDKQRESFLESDNLLDLQKKMNECNKQGLYPIHEAAFKGYVNAVRRFVESSKDKLQQLEIETRDDQQATPILLAAVGSNLDVIQLLLELGAKLDSRNLHGHGIVEIAGMRQDFKILNFLIGLPDSGINVWKRLLQAFQTDAEEISGSMGRTIEKLTEPHDKDTANEHDLTAWKKNVQALLDNDLIGTLCKVLQQRYKETLLSCLFIILNLLEYVNHTKNYEILNKLVKSGGLQILTQFLKIEASGQLTYDQDIVCLCGKVLERMSDSSDTCLHSYGAATDVTQNIFQGVSKLIQKVHNANLLFSYLDFISNLMEYGKNANIQISNLNVLVSALLGLYQNCSDNNFLFCSLMRLTLILSRDSNELQTQFIKEGLSAYLVIALKNNSPQLKELAINCVEVLSKTNVYVQKILIKDGIVPTLLSLLQKSQSMHQKVLTANALWSLAGDDAIQRKQMASKIRVNTLVDFLSTKSDELYTIACDALRVLFDVPPNVNQSLHDQFIDLHGANALVRILTHEKESVVLIAIRCIQRLCVTTGFNAYKPGQVEVRKYDGITFLVALLLHAKQDIIRAESAVALGYVCLENSEHMDITSETLDFNYAHIYKLLKSKHRSIQLLASTALTLFAFNNITQLRLMASVSGIPYAHFEHFLTGKDDFERIESAFQVVILSQLVVDEEQAVSSASGIKILIDMLVSKVSNVRFKTLSAERLGALARLKNGVADAITAINGVSLLCDLLYSDNEALQGTCSISLSNYSYHNESRRKLLYKCRHDPSLIEVLRFYNEYHNSVHKLSNRFFEDWHHYENVGLPALKKSSTKFSEKPVKAKIAATNVVKTVKFDQTELDFEFIETSQVFATDRSDDTQKSYTENENQNNGGEQPDNNENKEDDQNNMSDHIENTALETENNY